MSVLAAQQSPDRRRHSHDARRPAAVRATDDCDQNGARSWSVRKPGSPVAPSSNGHRCATPSQKSIDMHDGPCSSATRRWASCRISGTFSVDDVDAFARALADVLSLRVDDTGDSRALQASRSRPPSRSGRVAVTTIFPATHSLRRPGEKLRHSCERPNNDHSSSHAMPSKLAIALAAILATSTGAAARRQLPRGSRHRPSRDQHSRAIAREGVAGARLSNRSGCAVRALDGRWHERNRVTRPHERR